MTPTKYETSHNSIDSISTYLEVVDYTYHMSLCDDFQFQFQEKLNALDWQKDARHGDVFLPFFPSQDWTHLMSTKSWFEILL